MALASAAPVQRYWLHGQARATLAGPPALSRLTIAPFPPTRCSVLERLNRSDEAERRAAFDVLVHAYWQPIYAYLRLHWGVSADGAQDMTQAFLAAAWQKDFFVGYDASRARFRTFLRVCLDRFLNNQRKIERAQKRGGQIALVPLDFAAAEGSLDTTETATTLDVDALFRQEFLRALFARVLARLQAELSGRGREAVYRVFERYDLVDPGTRTYADLATEMNLPVTQVTNHLHAARRRFRELVLQELRSMSDNEQEYQADVQELLGVEVP
ncbi:MAG: RNA polymerase sigma factor [Longimicrobiales bacterium]